MTTILNIDGMSCEHCVRHVTNALTEVDGIQNVTVSLAANSATVEHADTVSLEAMKAAVEDAGYTVL